MLCRDQAVLFLQGYEVCRLKGRSNSRFCRNYGWAAEGSFSVSPLSAWTRTLKTRNLIETQRMLQPGGLFILSKSVTLKLQSLGCKGKLCGEA